MKARSFLAAILVSPLLLSASFAQQAVKPLSLIGKWQASAKHPSGAMITTSVELTQGSKFTSTTTVDEKPFMAASGTWTLTGTRLEWRYEHSSQPSIQPGFVDVDEVVSVSGTELTLSSKQSGQTHTYKRLP